MFLLAMFAPGAAYGDYAVKWYTVDGGGGKSTVSRSDSYAVRGTVGQPDPDTLTGTTYAVNGGFWTPGALPPLECTEYPESFVMNRCINFMPNNYNPTAFQVTLDELDANPECFAQGPCDGTDDWVWWVTVPVCTDEDGDDTGADPATDPCDYPNVWRSQLSADAGQAYAGPWPNPVNVCDCEVVPLGTYGVRATKDPLGAPFSKVLVELTQVKPGVKCWGDCVGSWTGTEWSPPNQVISMDDIMAAVFGFQHVPNAPYRKWVELSDDGPDMKLNFTDIQFLVMAFKGEPYPYSCPEDCP